MKIQFLNDTEWGRRDNHVMYSDVEPGLSEYAVEAWERQTLEPPDGEYPDWVLSIRGFPKGVIVIKTANLL